jgi:hypothetical protein
MLARDVVMQMLAGDRMRSDVVEDEQRRRPEPGW